MRYFLLFLLFTIFSTTQTFSQDFKLMDSIQIELGSFQERESFSTLYWRQFQDKIYLYEKLDSIILVNDLEGNMEGTIRLASVHIPNKFTPWRVEFEKDRIIAVDPGRMKLRVYDFNGSFLKEINLYKFFDQYTPYLKDHFEIDFENELIYTVLVPNKQPKYFFKLPRKPGKFYQESSLIGVYNFEGKRLESFANYDPLYFQGDLPYKDDFSFQRVGDELILEQDLAHQVTVFKLSNLMAAQYNFKGDSITQKLDALPRVTEVLTEESYHGMLIESYGYGAFLSFNSSQLVGRVYYKSAEDTTTSVAVENTKKRVKPVKGSCLTPSDQKLNQKDILADKLVYIRMVDWNTKKVVYDGKFALKGDFFFTGESIPPNEIWTQRYENGVMTIYKYRI